MNVKPVSVTPAGLAKYRADALIVPVLGAAKKSTKAPQLTELVGALDTKLQKRISDVLATTDFAGNAGQTFVLEGGRDISAKRLVLMGLGAPAALTLESLRRSAAGAILAAKTVHAQSVGIVIDDACVETLFADDVVQAVSEGMQLAAYRFFKYKKEEEKQWKKAIAKSVEFVTTDKARVADIRAGILRAEATVDATVYARDLINEPAVHVTPTSLAEAARAIAKATPEVKVTVMGEKQARALGMGSFLSVAAGSDQEAQFIHLAYKPKNVSKTTKRLVICGKGITFDSGGLSIKPGDSMHGMKMDMAGAATVLGLFTQITDLAPSVEVHGVIPATENMPSGKATRPGDVVTAMDGTTIEVTNTDAEGRLVLADAIAWSVKNLKPDYIVDLATLTGAQVVALGQEVAAYYTTSEELKEHFDEACAESGEAMWQMPLVEEYKPLVKSPVADLDNCPSTRWAGSIMGALFLEHFAKNIPWLHVDFAGPAIVDRQMLPYVPVGGSGFGVRTLIALLAELENDAV